MLGLSVGSFLKFTFWASMLASTSCAIWGVKTKRGSFLLLSGMLSTPFAIILFGYPSGRFFIAVPLLHIIALAFIRKKLIWAARVVLTLIVSFTLYFLTLYFRC